jgi:hypothetical protein
LPAGELVARLEGVRFGYEFDFVSKNRGYAGFIIEAKYMDVQVSLEPDPVRFRARERADPGARAVGRVPSCRTSRSPPRSRVQAAVEHRQALRRTYVGVDSTARSTSTITSAPRSATDRSTSPIS